MNRIGEYKGIETSQKKVAIAINRIGTIAKVPIASELKKNMLTNICDCDESRME